MASRQSPPSPAPANLWDRIKWVNGDRRAVQMNRILKLRTICVLRIWNETAFLSPLRHVMSCWSRLASSLQSRKHRQRVRKPQYLILMFLKVTWNWDYMRQRMARCVVFKTLNSENMYAQNTTLIALCWLFVTWPVGWNSSQIIHLLGDTKKAPGDCL